MYEAASIIAITRRRISLFCFFPLLFMSSRPSAPSGVVVTSWCLDLLWSRWSVGSMGLFFGVRGGNGRHQVSVPHVSIE